MTPRLQQSLLLFWHAWLGGGYLVAYLTADEDTYGMHLFAGYAVLAAVVVRLLAGLIAPNAAVFAIGSAVARAATLSSLGLQPFSSRPSAPPRRRARFRTR